MSSLFFSGFGSVFSILPIALLGMFLSNRSDADRSTKRPYMSYLDGVLLIGIIAVFVAVAVSISAIGKSLFDDGTYNDSGSFTDTTWKTLIIAFCILLPSVLILWFHGRQRTKIRSQSDFVGSAHSRTDRLFIYTVCFLSVAAIGVTVPLLLANVATILAPGIMGASRDSALRNALTTTIPLFGSLILLRTFWRQAADDRAPLTPTGVDVRMDETIG